MGVRIRTLEEALVAWLKDRMSALDVAILEGPVNAANYEVRKAERLAFKEVLGALPALKSKAEEGK